MCDGSFGVQKTWSIADQRTCHTIFEWIQARIDLIFGAQNFSNSETCPEIQSFQHIGDTHAVDHAKPRIEKSTSK